MRRGRVLLSAAMKTIALTIQFEDSVDTRAVRQFIEGGLSHVPGFRSLGVQVPPTVLPLVSVDSKGMESPLMVRVEYLCPKKVLAYHHLPMHDLHKLPALTPAQALALTEPSSPHRVPITEVDYLAALMHASRPLNAG